MTETTDTDDELALKKVADIVARAYELTDLLKEVLASDAEDMGPQVEDDFRQALATLRTVFADDPGDALAACADHQTDDGLVRTTHCDTCGAYYQPPVQSDECPHDTRALPMPDPGREAAAWAEADDSRLRLARALRAAATAAEDWGKRLAPTAEVAEPLKEAAQALEDMADGRP